MKPKKLNLKLLWMQFTDFLYPRLRLSLTERAVYFYLLRHTRLEGKLQLHCSMPWLAPIRPDPFANSLPSVDLDPFIKLEKSDFLKTRALRNSIHLRERGHCFYCLRRTDAHTQCLDHVQPRVKAGCNSYRNLVSCCLECNSQKGEQSAADFFRSLYRDRRLTASEFHAGLRRLDALLAGKLPPPVQHPDIPVGIHTNPMLRKGRPRRAFPA